MVIVMTIPQYEIDNKLYDAKKQLAVLFERKGCTDYEVLQLGEEVDRLLNEYCRLTRL